jgi:hypothetical protein
MLTSTSLDGLESNLNELTSEAYLHVLTTEELRDALFCESIKKAYEEVDGYVRSFDNSGKKEKFLLNVLNQIQIPGSIINLTRH